MLKRRLLEHESTTLCGECEKKQRGSGELARIARRLVVKNIILKL